MILYNLNSKEDCATMQWNVWAKKKKPVFLSGVVIKKNDLLNFVSAQKYLGEIL